MHASLPDIDFDTELLLERAGDGPTRDEVLNLLAGIAFREGNFERGVEALRRVVRWNKKNAVAHFNIGVALRELGRHEEEVAAYDDALAAQPRFFEALFNRGNALRALGRHSDALASFSEAIQIRPDCAEAFNNLGNVLGDLLRYDEALVNFDRALDLKPDFAEAHNNRGNALEGLARYGEALQSYQRAQQIDGDYADAHWNESLCRLLVGDYPEGWKKYEWRWRTQTYAPQAQLPLEKPLWLGVESLMGKTILLHAEGGLGDTLQFCRYVALVAARGARVLLEVQPELRRLLKGLAGVSAVLETGVPRPPFDFHCPLMSLPLALGTTRETIPACLPYLAPYPQDVTRWGSKVMHTSARLRVGLVWAGNPRLGIATSHAMDKRRSMPLSQFAPLFELHGIDFYSLQKGDAAVRQVNANPAAQKLIDITNEFDDFADTAAFIEHLDLVIAVDTSCAHLAGAMGKPVWLLNRYDSCWRWFMEGQESPWYPRVMRVFRQPSAGDWGPVVAEVASALRLETRESLMLAHEHSVTSRCAQPIPQGRK
jgi:tetratricopeptide (TPR) repeat protein